MPKLPFIAEIPEFKPRRHLGQDETLPKFQRDVLDALDVIEQRGEFSLGLALRAWNGVLIVGAVLVLALLVNLPIGAMAANAIKSFLAP